MDVCCLNRPFDDQTQERIKFESFVIKLILKNCIEGNWNLLNSDIILFEISKMKDERRLNKIIKILSISQRFIELDATIEKRGQEIKKKGFSPVDSLHIASAEIGRADTFLTTDDSIVRKYANVKKNLILP